MSRLKLLLGIILQFIVPLIGIWYAYKAAQLSDWYAPIAWTLIFYAVANITPAISFLLAWLRGELQNTDLELARHVTRQLLANAGDDVIFSLDPRFNKSTVLGEIRSRLPRKLASQFEMIPESLVFSLIMLVVTRGHRIYRLSRDTKYSVARNVTMGMFLPMALTLFLSGPQTGVSWNVWSGMNFQPLLPLQIGSAVVVTLLPLVFYRIVLGKIHYEWEGWTQSFLAVLYAPPVEELLFGYIMVTFIASIGLSMGLSMWVAVWVGILISMPYFALCHPMDRAFNLDFMISRCMFGLLVISLGLPAGILAHALTNGSMDVIGWSRRKRK